MDQQIKELYNFGSCDVADALAGLGVSSYLQDIAPFTVSQRIVGLAHTCEMVNVSDMRPACSTNHVDSASPGSIIVIKAPLNCIHAVFGGILAARANYIGVRGLVTDGRIRDVKEMKDAKFPAFATNHSVLGPKGLSKVVSIKEHIIFGSQTPVTVHQDDIILADEDGVVCIPPHLVEHVIEACRKILKEEEQCKAAISAGRTLQEVFAKYR